MWQIYDFNFSFLPVFGKIINWMHSGEWIGQIEIIEFTLATAVSTGIIQLSSLCFIWTMIFIILIIFNIYFIIFIIIFIYSNYY